MSFDRFDICEAYYMYDVLWGPTPYGARLHRMKYKPHHSLDLDTMSENAKAIYGALVRRHQRLYVGYERYYRRASNPIPWPGIMNMPAGNARVWLILRGLLKAVESYVPFRNHSVDCAGRQA
jgi:hypothetical protein